MDKPCERDIFRIILPINFKFDLLCHITQRTDAFDFGLSAKSKMTTINILKKMLSFILSPKSRQLVLI